MVTDRSPSGVVEADDGDVGVEATTGEGQRGRSKGRRCTRFGPPGSSNQWEKKLRGPEYL